MVASAISKISFPCQPMPFYSSPDILLLIWRRGFVVVTYRSVCTERASCCGAFRSWRYPWLFHSVSVVFSHSWFLSVCDDILIFAVLPGVDRVSLGAESSSRSSLVKPRSAHLPKILSPKSLPDAVAVRFQSFAYRPMLVRNE